MDSIQDQVNTLSIKVDTLQQVTEQFGNRILAALADLKSASSSGEHQSHLLHDSSAYSYQRHSGLDAVTDHKDVLMDSDYPNSDLHSDRELSPDLQIRRLTAQLTAAYNRIAALEEQLLSKRVHS
jgi:hypothetical protein